MWTGAVSPQTKQLPPLIVTVLVCLWGSEHGLFDSSSAPFSLALKTYWCSTNSQVSPRPVDSYEFFLPKFAAVLVQWCEPLVQGLWMFSDSSPRCSHRTAGQVALAPHSVLSHVSETWVCTREINGKAKPEVLVGTGTSHWQHPSGICLIWLKKPPYIVNKIWVNSQNKQQEQFILKSIYSAVYNQFQLWVELIWMLYGLGFRQSLQPKAQISFKSICSCSFLNKMEL